MPHVLAPAQPSLEELADLAERLEVAKEAAGLGIHEQDLASGTIRWDARARELWGVDPTDPVTPDTFLAGLHPDDRAPAQAALEQALDPAGDGAYSAEFRVRSRADGRERWVAATGRVTFDRGRAVRLLGAVQDVTERRQAQALLRDRLAAEEQLARVAASVPGLICSYRLGPDGKASMPFAAEGLEDLYGIPREVLARDMTPVFARLHEDDVAAVKDSIAASARSMSRWHAEFRYHHPTRGERWLEGWSMPVGQPDGSIVWDGYVNDVTDRKRAAAALGASEQRATERAAELQAVLDAVPAAVWIARDPRGDRIEGNRFAAEILRRPRGSNMSLTAPEVDRPTNFRVERDGAPLEEDDLPIQKAARSGVEIRDCEFDLAFGDGGVRHLLGNATPIVHGGRSIGSVGAFIDITDRKQAEAALREAARRKDEFLGMLSHELRNPLAPIRNSLYLLERTAPDSPEAARARQVLRRQTDHITRLVDDLLDVTRIARGKIALQRRRIDLREIVRKTTDDLRSLFDGGVALRVEHSAGPVWIDADATRIAQVLGNLLHNAAKFTPPGGAVHVTVTGSDGRAELRVRDDGHGIEPEQIGRMFEAFAQADQVVARTKGGLGLGLALVKGLVELHGGSVRAHSDGIGRGAEFTVTLPLTTAERAGATPRPAAPGAQGRRVLVIEDHADTGQTLADILTLQGYRVDVAHEGRTGLALARALTPDVVLCDIGLPDVDGYEIARTLRQDPALRGTRLVALSGYALPEDRRRAFEAGFDAHVAKPPAAEELLAVVAEARPPSA